MYNVEAFKQGLMLYVVAIIVILLAIWLIINGIFLLLYVTKLFREPKIWIIANVMGFIILTALITPALLDVFTESYYIIENVVDIDADYSANNSTKYILIKDKDGKVYTCYDFLIDKDSLKDINYPGMAIYAKHSKLLLCYYSHDAIQ